MRLPAAEHFDEDLGGVDEELGVPLNGIEDGEAEHEEGSDEAAAALRFRPAGMVVVGVVHAPWQGGENA